MRAAPVHAFASRSAAPPEPGVGTPQGRRTPWAIAGLILLVAAAYGQTLGFDLVWDDHVLVIGNLFRQGGVTLREAFTGPTSPLPGQMPRADRMYRPLLAMSVAADRAVWGLRPGAFHLSSVLAHLAVVLLLCRLAWRLTGSRAAGLFAAALLAVHPSAVEAVAFLSARMDLFVGLGIAAVLLLVRNCLRAGGRWRLGGALLCFAFALGAKETAVVIPAMVTWAAWVYPEWFTGPGGAARGTARAARVAPFWVVLGAYGALRRAVTGSVTPTALPLADVPDQALRALVGIATSFRMILVSRPTAGRIRVEPPTGVTDARVLAGLAVVALLLGGLWWLRRRHPAGALALGCAVAAFVPVSNLLPVYWEREIYASERALYPALVGWCLFLGVAFHALAPSPRRGPHRARTLVSALGGAVIGTFLLVTIVKAASWRDDVTLWTAAAAVDPDSVLARYNLGMALAQAGDPGRAKAVAREAEARFPADPRMSYLKGWIAELEGKHHEALQQYEQAIALGAREPAVFRQAAAMAARVHEWDRAGRWLAVAVERFPREAWPQVGLGWYEQRQGHVDRAMAHSDRAAQLEPNSPERLWFQAQLLAAEGRVAEAVQACEAALTLDPWFVPARRALALIAEQEGRIAAAIGQWQRIQSLPGGHRREAEMHIRRLEVGGRGGTLRP